MVDFVSHECFHIVPLLIASEELSNFDNDPKIATLWMYEGTDRYLLTFQINKVNEDADFITQ